MQATRFERLRLLVSADEYRALSELSDQELRSIPDQARALIRERLRELALLPKAEPLAEASDARIAS